MSILQSPPTNLRVFLDLLRSEHDIVEIEAEVDPYLEAAEIHRRVIASGGPAILFRNIKGSPFPLVTNLFGTVKRVELAFGNRPGELLNKIARAPEELLPPTFQKLWEERTLLTSLLKVGLSKSMHAPVLDVVNMPAKLTTLPLLTTWLEDGGPFVTLPLVHTAHPESGIPNLGMYRLQRFSDSETGFHTQIGKGAGFHLGVAKTKCESLPVNVYIGGPPALILGAVAPLPENVSELLFTSLVLGKKLATHPNPFGPLPVISEAEFAIIGEVDPNSSAPEGPFGDHYGYYSLKHDYPVLKVRAMTHRRDPICAATVVGKPRQEDFYLGDYLQELLSPLIKLVMPSVVDIWAYGETGYHSLAGAIVRERYKREAMTSAFRILGEGQLALTKFLLVTDRAAPLRNFRATLEAVLERADFRTDLFIFSNLSMDTLDYTGPKVNHGSKGVLLGVGDPIRKLEAEYHGELPRPLENAAVFCPGCLVVDGASFAASPSLASEIANASQLSNWPLIILVDDAMKTCESESNFLWTTFTRFEPGADIYSKSRSVVRNHISYDSPVVIDARFKPNYPAELECDINTARLVDVRWGEYFPR